ncbi:pyrroline-5-carboxylate reductase [Microvirga sp. W0021]|uniref:Pyrroline-5-carboxylate reductase n=1 Tax=Hohaiivirga grylli TaxID=3133970 RepID=A0ABV0BKM3_9HYPH
MAPVASDFPSSLMLVGAGKMGGSLLEGWIKAGFPGDRVIVSDPYPSEEMAVYCVQHGITLNPASAPFEPEALVLAIKPQMLESSAAAINNFIGKSTVIISILAGKTISNLQSYLTNATAIVRTMPNLPASIGHGATGAYANERTSGRQKSQVDALLKTSGTTEWLSREEQIDAVTAISGSGPAYIFYLTECLAEAGIQLGLPRELSERLARATVTGSAALMSESSLAPSKLRENVTSPGGTTAAALNNLMAPDGLQPLMNKATASAKKRAGELAG